MSEVLQRGLLRDVTEEEIRTYREEGAVHLPAILAPEWVEKIGKGIDEAIYSQWDAPGIAAYNASDSADMIVANGGKVLTDPRAEAIRERGRFLSMIGAWTINDKIRDAALNTPLGYIAGRLFGASKVNFYDAQTLIKEPGTREYTAFHTDEPYYHLHGDQVCGMWVSPDVKTARHALRPRIASLGNLFSAERLCQPADARRTHGPRPRRRGTSASAGH